MQRTDIAELNQSLRRNINRARGYQPPIELIIERIDTRRGKQARP